VIQPEIRSLKALNPNNPIIAVINDTGASAAYYVAVDAIYASRASVVGSIGVRIDSFCFTDAMARLGIERCLYVAGDYERVLDIFSPVHSEKAAHEYSLRDGIMDRLLELRSADVPFTWLSYRRKVRQV
jgi:protease-4